MAKLVDALDLGSSEETHRGSIPFTRIIVNKKMINRRSILKKISSIKCQLDIIISNIEIKNERDRAFSKLSNTVKIDGFRKGKIPKVILEQYYSISIDKQVLEILLDKSYKRALIEHQLFTVATPMVKNLSKLIPGEDFQYSIIVEIKPEIRLTKYKNLEFSVNNFNINENDILNELKRLQNSESVVRISLDKTVQPQSTIKVKSKVMVSGELNKNFSKESIIIDIGTSQYICDIEEFIIGKSVGDKITVQKKIKKDSSILDFRGKLVKFFIEIRQILVKKRPTLNDYFAQCILKKFNTLKDLKEDIRKGFYKLKKIREKNNIEKTVLDLLIEKNPFMIPQSMISNQAQRIAFHNLKSIEPDSKKHREMLQYYGKEIFAESKIRAEKTIRAVLILESIAKLENIVIDEKKIIQIISIENSKIKMSEKQKQENYKDLKFHFIQRKALAFVVGNAKINIVQTPFHSIE